MNSPGRTYLLKSELFGCYQKGKKIAEPQIGGKPIPLGKELPKEEEILEPLNSLDMSAKDAISHIESASPEELGGFLAEDEDRVTVLDAWDERFPPEEESEGGLEGESEEGVEEE